MNTLLYVSIGVLSGIISGMGIGGGMVLIPALSLLFHMNQQTAQNINLIYFIPTAAIALITHIKNRCLEKKVLLKIIITGILSAIAGAFLALSIDPAILKRLFGGFLIIMGLFELKKKQ